MKIEAIVYKVPEICHSLTMMRTGKFNVIQLTVHLYNEADHSTKLLANGTIEFDTPEFDGQLMTVARDLYGRNGVMPNCSDAQMAELFCKVMQFREFKTNDFKAA
jgi:hypothetical protein